MGNGVISLLWQLQCNCNPDHDKFSSFSKGAFLWDDPEQDQWSKITRIMVDEMSRWILVQSGFNCCGNFSKCLGLWRRSLCSMIFWSYWSWKTVSSQVHMPVRPRLLHRMDLVSFRIFRKNLGNLREFFGQMVYRPPWQKIARTPMWNTVMITQIVTLSNTQGSKYKQCKKN